MKEKNKYILFAIVAIVMFVIFTILGLINDFSKDKDKETDEEQNVYVEVPDGDSMEMTVSKTDAYLVGSSSKIEDYWDACEAAKEEEEDLMTGKGGGGGYSDTGKTSSEELFGSSEAQAPKPKTASGGSNPYRESAAEREARHQRRREEAIDMAVTMQKGQGAQASDFSEGEEEMQPQRIEIPSGAEVRKAEVISSLDDGWNGGTISSLGESEGDVFEDPFHPFRCMFVRQEKIKSGARVPVRLLEDLVVEGTLIPKNTHLSASCNLGSRLELEIASIEMGGRIYTIGFEAYDTDGSKGIYCPDAGEAGRTARSRATSLAGSTLSSRIGRIAGDIVNTGVALAENAGGERTVTIPSGYTFFIVKKKQL